ncbi:MAG: GNAT family N-acetyltransferase [Myxococcaceae bacterium]
MSEVRVESFGGEDKPLEAFFELPGRVERLNEGQAKAERAGTEALLDPSRAYFKNAEARSFVAFRDGKAVGRITAFHNRLLPTEKLRFGLVGLFACENDPEAARSLMTNAATWLSEHGLTAMRGPMAGDIWHRWRLMTRGFDTAAFPGEPRNPSYYPGLLSACGFAPVRTYSTKQVTDLDAQLAHFSAPAALNAKRGYSFRNVNRAGWEQDLQHVYELCRHSFATRWSVTETTYEDFAEVYNRWLRRVGSEQIVLALDKSKAVVGLGLAVTAPQDTLNIRTVAVYPHAAGFGLGQAISAELYRRAIAAGIKTVHHCLMSPNTPPQFWDHGLGSVTREYTMYERST